jgi:hypothetical protein
MADTGPGLEELGVTILAVSETSLHDRVDEVELGYPAGRDLNSAIQALWLGAERVEVIAAKAPLPPRIRPISNERAWPTDSGVACTTTKSRASASASESHVRIRVPRARAALRTGLSFELLSTLTAMTGRPSFAHSSTIRDWRAASESGGPSQRSVKPSAWAASSVPCRQSSK